MAEKTLSETLERFSEVCSRLEALRVLKCLHSAASESARRAKSPTSIIITQTIASIVAEAFRTYERTQPEAPK